MPQKLWLTYGIGLRKIAKCLTLKLEVRKESEADGMHHVPAMSPRTERCCHWEDEFS
jgi:hypothetical protein